MSGDIGISPTVNISFDLGATGNCCYFWIHAGFVWMPVIHVLALYLLVQPMLPAT